LSAPSVIGYGQVAATRAVFKNANGTPLAGVPVTVWARAHGGSTWTLYNRLTTDSTGTVTRNFTPMRNDDFRFTYAGTTGFAPVTVIKTVLVRPHVTGALSSYSIRLGHSTVMTGAITPVSQGTRTLAEQLIAGHWHVLASEGTGPHGGFRFVLTPKARGTKIYRVVVAATGGRLAGISPTLTLRVS